MNVVIFHPVPLPPRDYGGVERVVLWLAKGLTERGHSVSVGASPGSQLPDGAKLIPVSRENSSALQFLNQIPKGTDVVHFMAPPEEEVWSQLPCQGLLTVHGNGKPGEKFQKNTVFLSKDHARRHGSDSYVYNGIDPGEYVFDPVGKKDWHLFLSKTSWSVKNLKGAMRLATKAHAKMKIAGGNRPIGARIRSYFSRQFDWVGPVAGTQKASLLSQAKSLLFPVKWPEPFGLVIAEALISGTPVIGSNQGSLPELITSETGATLDLNEEDAWISAIQNPKWAPEACRERAMKYFHYRQMAESYEKVYLKLSKGS